MPRARARFWMATPSLVAMPLDLVATAEQMTRQASTPAALSRSAACENRADEDWARALEIALLMSSLILSWRPPSIDRQETRI